MYERALQAGASTARRAGYIAGASVSVIRDAVSVTGWSRWGVVCDESRAPYSSLGWSWVSATDNRAVSRDRDVRTL